MPRAAARLCLEVKNVRVERLQDISEDDAKAEGVIKLPNGRYVMPGSRYHKLGLGYASAVLAFAVGFSEIYPDTSHDTWVWVIEFKRVSA